MNLPEIIRQLGGPAEIGRHLGIRGQAISHWLRKDQVPIDRVPSLLRLAKKKRFGLRADELRPDIDWAAVK
jgi:DNA-binding transcriptional regulator YdaS (Cro superfamily)